MPAEQPAVLKLLKGRHAGVDSGGRPVKLPPRFRRTSPLPPEWLSAEARAEWDRVSPELARLDLTKSEDRAALAAYCETWAVFVSATETIQREGLTIDAKQGTLPHPAVGIQRNTGKELRAWANQFGLTPVAESKLEPADGDDGTDSPFG